MDLAILIPTLCIVGLMILGVPVWIAMFVGVIPYFTSLNGLNFSAATVVQRMIATTEQSTYLAIPFFVTAGAIMNYCGISRRLMDLADAFVGHFKGGLAQVNVVLSALMGGLSGSAASDAAQDCKILVPEMSKKGYDIEFSAAVTVASSLITPIIPPGMGLITYAMLANVSVGKMFAAGYLPGILTTVAMMVLVYVICKKKNYKGSRTKMAPLKEICALFIKAFWALTIPFGLFMALRAGVFTATECGAICAVFAVIIGAFFYKDLKWEHAWPILQESFLGTATVMMTCAGATTMSYWLSVERIPNQLAQLIVNANLPDIAFLLFVELILLVFGMFMTGGVTLFTPLLAPVAVALGIDPVHFGIVLVFTLGIGNMSPPFGVVLYQVASLLNIKLEKLIKATIPFLLLMIGLAILFALVPWISTVVPGMM